MAAADEVAALYSKLRDAQSHHLTAAQKASIWDLKITEPIVQEIQIVKIRGRNEKLDAQRVAVERVSKEAVAEAKELELEARAAGWGDHPY